MRGNDVLELVAKVRVQVEGAGVSCNRCVVSPVDWPEMEAEAQLLLAEKGDPSAPRNPFPLLPQMIGMPCFITPEIAPGNVHVGEWQSFEIAALLKERGL